MDVQFTVMLHHLYELRNAARNGHAQVNGLDMAGVPSPVKMEEEQRRQCQDILDKMPEHRFLFQQMNMKQEPMMMNGNGELPPIGSMNRMPGHAPRGRPPASMQNNGVLTPDRKHVCPHCYKTFKSRQQLMQHNLVHSNLRKYRCNFCERAFKQLSHLHQHHRIHTGEKPYRCPLLGCDRAFPQLSNLQHHIRNHDKLVDSTFQCLQCDRAYPNEATLKAHNTRMHLHAKPLDLRQNHAPTQIQTTQQPQSSMAPSSMTSMISPFDNIQNHFNTQRSRKRKASRPQQLFMTSNMTHAQGGPLTPEDDDVVIVEAKQICTSLGGNEVPSEDQCSKGVKRFSSMDGKQLRAFQQSMANVIVKDDSQREAIRGFPFQRNESRETLSFELSQQNNIMNAFHTPDREGGGGFPIDMRGNRFPLHSQTKNLTHLRETTHRKYQSQFNFPFSPHGFDQSVWQPKHFNTKFVDVTCSPVHRDSNVVEQDMFAEDDDALVTDFEENQRRRRELILSYHKQYAEKKLGKKDGGDQKSENNSEDEDFFDGGHNTRYTKTNDVGHENEVPRQRNQHHTHTFSSTCHQNAMNKNDHGEKTVSMQDKECMKIEKQQKNGLEFSYRNGYDHDFNVYKEQAFDNYRKLSRFNNAENYQQSLPYQYIADDIPTCESSSGDQKLGQNDERKLKGEQLIKASHTDKGREDYREALRNAYLNKTTNQRRGDSGYWSTSTGSQRSVDEVQSQSSTEDVGQPHHSFSSRIPLDVFEDPMN